MIIFTENRSAEAKETRALEIAQRGWVLNGEPYRVENGAVWLPEKALADQDVSDLPWQKDK